MMREIRLGWPKSRCAPWHRLPRKQRDRVLRLDDQVRNWIAWLYQTGSIHDRSPPKPNECLPYGNRLDQTLAIPDVADTRAHRSADGWTAGLPIAGPCELPNPFG